jgi:hypothetical protein
MRRKYVNIIGIGRVFVVMRGWEWKKRGAWLYITNAYRWHALCGWACPRRCARASRSPGHYLQTHACRYGE